MSRSTRRREGRGAPSPDAAPTAGHTEPSNVTTTRRRLAHLLALGAVRAAVGAIDPGATVATTTEKS